MNEPLTIEELKALPLGEWVWITMETEDSYIVGYYQLIQPLYTRLNAVGAVDLDLSYSDYGKTWTAYKNKEQAEGADDIERKAQKAMAENIFQEMYDIVNESRDEVITVTADDVKRIAKRYGVEVRK